MKESVTLEKSGRSTGPPEVQSIRILHVDDDLSYRDLCARYLKNDSDFNYQITGTSSAAGAIDMCNQNSYDCLLLDYELPDATGTELLSSLHDVVGDALPPAVILTAAGSEKVATYAIRANAADFISKNDVNSRSLRRTIRNLVERFRLLNDIRTRSEELNSAYVELSHKNDEIKNFYHTVSHEVKTPLSAIREFISLLNDEVAGPVNQNQKELLGYAVESCDQIANHFNDLIELTRLETRKHAMQFNLESPTKLISRSIIGLEGVAREKCIRLEHRAPIDLPNLYLDANRVVQVLSNLISNAIKYTESGGTVQIEAAVNSVDDCVEVRVIDAGCGIDSSHIARIFDRLYQINSDADNPFNGGLGLGLSIAREIAQLHGGKLTVDSKLGEGSTFILQLPLTREGANELLMMRV